MSCTKTNELARVLRTPSVLRALQQCAECPRHRCECPLRYIDAEADALIRESGLTVEQLRRVGHRLQRHHAEAENLKIARERVANMLAGLEPAFGLGEWMLEQCIPDETPTTEEEWEDHSRNDGWSVRHTFRTDPPIERTSFEFEAVEGFAKYLAISARASGNLEAGQAARGAFKVVPLDPVRRLAQAIHDEATADLKGADLGELTPRERELMRRAFASGCRGHALVASLACLITNLAWIAALVGGVL